MNPLTRFAVLATLTAFLGLSALEAFHTHSGLQTEAHCSICQIAHKTPALLSAGSAAGPQWVSTRALTPAASPSYIQFVFIAHGLSPPSANS